MVVCPSFPQIRCFDAPLQPNALTDVKNIVMRNTETGVERDGITVEGLPASLAGDNCFGCVLVPGRKRERGGGDITGAAIPLGPQLDL